MTTDDETEVRSKNTPAITAYAAGAVKGNEKKIFESVTLRMQNTTL